MNAEPNWLAVGLRTDRTFRYVVKGLRERGVHLQVIHLEAWLAVSLRANDPMLTAISLLENRIQPGTLVYHRLQDVSRCIENATAANLARQLYKMLLSRLREPDGYVVINRPQLGASNFSKILHLQRLAELAINYGIRISSTLVTNKAQSARVWMESQIGPVITKGVSSAKSICRVVSAKELDGRNLFGSPALFQPQIDGPELRVHVVGQHLIAELICSSATDYRFRQRNDLVSYERVNLPKILSDFCLAVNAKEQLMVSGIDFKIARNGAVYLLEVNSMPAFKGYDIRSGGAIMNALVACGRQLHESRNRPPSLVDLISHAPDSTV